MRNPGGHAVITNPLPSKQRLDGGRIEMVCEGITEYDTFSCGHCGAVRHVRPKERPEDIGGLCKQCMRLICPGCVDHGGCTPLEKALEMHEARVTALRSYGL